MGAAFARPLLLPCRRACGTTPIQPTGEVCPAPDLARGQSGARTAPAPTRARAGTGARRIRANQGPAAWASRAAGRTERTGTKQDGGTTCRMLTDTASRRPARGSAAMKSPSPACGLPHAHISHGSVHPMRPDSRIAQAFMSPSPALVESGTRPREGGDPSLTLDASATGGEAGRYRGDKSAYEPKAGPRLERPGRRLRVMRGNATPRGRRCVNPVTLAGEAGRGSATVRTGKACRIEGGAGPMPEQDTGYAPCACGT